MPPDISKILADIYLLDPSLKKHEAELTELIQNLLLSKPDTKFDEAFARRLHSQLMSAEPTEHSSLIHNYTASMKKMIYTLFGSAAVVAAALLITIFSGKLNDPTSRLLSLRNPSPEESSVRRLAANAFGSLAINSPGADKKGGNVQAPATPAMNQATDVAPTAKMMASTAAGVGTLSVGPTAMIAPYSPPYAFLYKGDELKLTDTSVDVFRRIKPSSGRTDLASALTGVSIGGVNLGSFGGSSLMSFELRQPTADGYVLSVQVGEGTLGISRATPFYIQPMPLTANGSDDGKQAIPADAELISIATSFVQSHGIDLSSYAAPVVQNTWQGGIPVDIISARPTMAPAELARFAYLPQSITVLFPRTVGGRIVYDQGGTASGISVNVNVQNKAVESVWGIQTTEYESSAYTAETDTTKILSILERGGLYGDGHPTDAQVPVIELGTPERVYMMYWKYDNNANEELLVPALRFPVTKVPSNTYYYQQSIVIPLVQEILNSNPNPGPIMYMKGATGVSEPAVGAVASPPTIVSTPAK